MDFITAIILGAVEGITEFLPVSSTGHLIILNQWLSFSPGFTKTFDIVIQLGAILAVIIFFWDKIWPFSAKNKDGAIWGTWKKVVVAVIPAIVVGAAVGSFVQAKLFNPFVVAAMLIVGGIVLIWIESRPKKADKIESVAALTYKTAFYVGLIQCISLIPGTSRSASTIIGAMLLGASRGVAAEFSFLLAIPTMIAATGYSLLKTGLSLSGHEIVLLAIGFIAAFGFAWAVIGAFMRYVRAKSFKPFGWYRIALGILVILLLR